MNKSTMNKRILYFLLIIVLFSTSCSRYTFQTVNSVQPQFQLITDTLHAKVTVNKQKKIEGTAVYQSVLIFTTKMPSNFADNDVVKYQNDIVSQLKSAAVWDAVTNNNVDILVAPKFNIIFKNTLFTKEIIVKVEGHGALFQLK